MDVDMRAATTNVVFVDEDMVDLISPQDNGDDSNDEDDWVIFKSKVTRRRRLLATKTGTQQLHSRPKCTRKRLLHLKEVIRKKEQAPKVTASPPLPHEDDLLEQPL